MRAESAIDTAQPGTRHPEPGHAIPSGVHDAPVGILAWRARPEEAGAALTRLADLHRDACTAQAAGRANAMWIALASPAQWRAQLDLLAQRLGETLDAGVLTQRYPLLGVPFAVKDNIDVAGIATTAACPDAAQVPAAHATAVQRLVDAGALWLGKTNLDQFATGLVGTRSPFGRPASIDDPTRISGGSSSGSAAAVAAGWVPFALGTDTAGSGRVPAGFNGLVGLKPTPGRVSTAGVLPACRTLDCVSVFAARLEDACRVLAVVEGPDASDPYSAFVPGPARLSPHPSVPVRVGIPAVPRFFGDAGYPAAHAAAVERLRSLGCRVVPLDFGLLHEVAQLLYEGPWVAERHAAVQALFDDRPDAIDPTVRRVIGKAIGLTATDTFRAQYRLKALQRQAAAVWRDVDVLMVPTAPGHPTFAEVDADPIGVNSLLGTYTNFVNLLGWCALALPSGRTAAGLPYGITFIGPGGHDAALAVLGQSWLGQAADPAPVPAPAVAPTMPLAVVGAHLHGLPLNGQLLERGAVFREATRTAPCYRLHALPGTVPPKPGLVRVAQGGAAIALEVWDVPTAGVGSFLAGIPAPLGLGSVELADGRSVHGFLCEGHAVVGAPDITHLGGWRAYLASLA